MSLSSYRAGVLLTELKERIDVIAGGSTDVGPSILARRRNQEGRRIGERRSEI